ncbi:hypothetical protein CPSG_09029 [Coccidioides posadasii str. Silveira]|uniref:Uncharacterized protein n=1 Tax=Coccidioides posadasii (strain RMSCC 757 / Silveira) TaxID=443226 RepID=E9DGT0_COCPS|nr:hypothetical protein CPSG_09029 [Coccidioides posadasii str. Silveira]
MLKMSSYLDIRCSRRLRRRNRRELRHSHRILTRDGLHAKDLCTISTGFTNEERIYFESWPGHAVVAETMETPGTVLSFPAFQVVTSYGTAYTTCETSEVETANANPHRNAGSGVTVSRPLRGV